MAKLLSTYLSLSNELNTLGVFDCFVDSDSRFFINITKLKGSSTHEFSQSYNHILSFFTD